MMKYSFISLIAAITMCIAAQTTKAEGRMAVEQPDTISLVESIDDVTIVARQPKQHFGLREQPLSSSVLGEQQLQRERVLAIKDLSAIMPNFYQPDYGSKMTSSIYVRGFGARIDQPVIGLTVDGVPYLNKNNYDFDMLDVVRVELLRGPQSTLYGRNTMGGQMNVYTLSPMNYQGLRGSVEYGSGATLRAKASYYGRSQSGKFGYSVGGYHNRVDEGFFDNAYDGRDVDWGQSSGGRLRLVGDLGRGWEIDNTASFGYNEEGGYAYMLYDMEKDELHDVNYNDPSGYMRYSFSDGLMLTHVGEKLKFTSTTSYQFMHDRMVMDQDYTPLSIFTLKQEQHEHAFTEDLVLRTVEQDRRWKWLTGAYGFYKKIDMGAPVTILDYGIENLILGNMPDMLKSILEFDRDNMVIDSNFDLKTYGLAIYHESSLTAGERWRFTAGLRLDYESSTMDYDNYSEIGYKMGAMRPGMAPMIPDFRTVEVPFKGREELDYLELLPKFAVNFTTGIGDLYATATRGYKAGGFNTQIFSDILQERVKDALMGDAMAAMGRPSEPSEEGDASITTYDPEYSWNYEVGGHLQFAEKRLLLDFAAFWIECRDQQLTVFPDGLTTGRMMSNAGKSRSRGFETSLQWQRSTPHRGLSVTANYGFTHARFEEFNDGVNDYSGNYLPYAPQHTAAVSASYRFNVGGGLLRYIDLDASWQGAGKIFWDEANTLEQGFYSQLNASVTLHTRNVSLSLWGRNLTDTDFYTFYFKSMTNNFYNHGKPCRIGATLNFAF